MLYFTQAGQRVFNVNINGQDVLTNFDIVAQAGGTSRRWTSSSLVNVTNGQVAIRFTPVRDNALVNGIEVIPAGGSTPTPTVAVSVSPSTASVSAGQTLQFSATVTGTTNTGVTWSVLGGGPGTISASGLYTAPGTVTGTQSATIVATSQASSTVSGRATVTLSGTPAFQPVRINSGAGAVTGSDGVAWSADAGFTSSSVWNTNSAVAGATTPAYQSLRFGNFSYVLQVPNGTRTVNLKFAELYFTQAGKRVFNVTINGQKVLSNFDIVAAAGGGMKAVDRQFQVSVTNGQLKIDFTPVVDNAQVNAIEVVQ